MIRSRLDRVEEMFAEETRLGLLGGNPSCYSDLMHPERPQEDTMNEDLAVDRQIEDRNERLAEEWADLPEFDLPAEDRCDTCDTPAASAVVDEDDEDACPECGSINVEDPSKVAEHNARKAVRQGYRVGAAKIALTAEAHWIRERTARLRAETEKMLAEATTGHDRAKAYAYGEGGFGALLDLAAGRLDAIRETLTGEEAPKV